MRLRRLPPLAWGAQQSRRNPPSRTWIIRHGRQDIGQYDLQALLSRQPASGWPFQQRRGVVEAQPARGWHPRQRTGHDGRSCLEYFQSFPGALLECCYSCGIAGATEPLLPQGSSNRQAGARPKGFWGLRLLQSVGTMPPLGEQCHAERGERVGGGTRD